MKPLGLLFVFLLLIGTASATAYELPVGLRIKTTNVTWTLNEAVDLTGDVLTNEGNANEMLLGLEKHTFITNSNRPVEVSLETFTGKYEWNVTSVPADTTINWTVGNFTQTQKLYVDGVYSETLEPDANGRVNFERTISASTSYELFTSTSDLGASLTGSLYYTGCGPTLTCSGCEPEDQTPSVGIFELENTNPINSIDVYGYLSKDCNAGWNIYLGDSNVFGSATELTTSNQTILTIPASSTVYVWNFYTCTNVAGTGKEPNCAIGFAQAS